MDFRQAPVAPFLLRLLLVLVGLTSIVGVRSAHGQDIRLDGDRIPLVAALATFMEQSGWDVVYAQSLVEGLASSCTYTGDEPEAAIACILADTGLRAELTGPGQFVLVRAAASTRSTLAGFVRDRQTGEALPGAHVFIGDLSTGTITSAAGFFAFASIPSGMYPVRVSYVGFRTVDTLLVTQLGPHFIELREMLYRAERIVVESAETIRADLGMVPGLVSMPIQRLQELPSSLGGQDLLEALKWMSGISRAGEVTGGLIVRGGSPDQNLYLVDGAPIYQPWHAFSLVSTFQTETFRRIRLYRGSFPAEYGGRISAVLDAELTDGKRPEPRASGAIGTLAARFLIESPITAKSSFMLAARRSYIDLITGRVHPVSDDEGRVDTLRTGYFFDDWAGKIVFRPDKDSRFSASWYEGGDNLDVRLPFDISLDRSAWLRPADLVFELEEFWRNRLLSLRYERLLSAEWFVTGTAYETRYDARESSFVQPSRTADVRSLYEVGLRDLGAGIHFDHYRSLVHQLRFGATIVHHRFDSSVDALIAYAPGVYDRIAQVSDADVFEAGLYAQDVWRPLSALSIIGGVRLEYFGGGNQVRLSPRISAEWSVPRLRTVVRVGVSRNHQFLHRVRDRYSFLYDLVSSRWVPSGRTTRAAAGTHTSLGLEIRPATGVDIRVGGYVRTTDHILLPADEFRTKDGFVGPGIELGTLLGQYVAGETRAAGLEIDVLIDQPGWSSTVAYTGSRTESRFLGPADESWRPSRFDVPRSFSAVARRKLGHWSFGAALTWRSGYPVTVPTAHYELGNPIGTGTFTYLERPEINNGRLPPYVRADIEFAYAFSWIGGDWRFRLQVYNVLSKRNVVYRSYSPSGSSLVSSDRLGLPILPLFELALDL